MARKNVVAVSRSPEDNDEGANNLDGNLSREDFNRT